MSYLILLFGVIWVLFLLGIAPTPTARGTPAGIRLEDGFSTKITFAANPTVSLWEMTVKPPGVDGGDKIDTGTMHNTVWRTFAPRSLKTLMPSTGKAAYDPNVTAQLVALVNVRTTVTVTYPDGTTEAFFGYLKSFEFDENTEGQMPTGTFTIEPTNTDTAHAEQGPVIGNVPGT